MGGSFYLDFRDAFYPSDGAPGNPYSGVTGGSDFGIKYDCYTKTFYRSISYPNSNSIYVPIQEDEIVGIRDIKNLSHTPKTEVFPNFWSHPLHIFTKTNENPLLYCGAFPGSNVSSYKLFRTITPIPGPGITSYYDINEYEFTE